MAKKYVAIDSDPTDAELDEWERSVIGYAEPHSVSLRLIKALRACRQQSKVADAVIELARKIPHGRNNATQVFLEALAARDREQDGGV